MREQQLTPPTPEQLAFARQLKGMTENLHKLAKKAGEAGIWMDDYTRSGEPLFKWNMNMERPLSLLDMELMEPQYE